MDSRLVGWARAVKSRRRHGGAAVPPLWLFTDQGRGGDVVAAVRGLPRGLCGVVFRHDGVAGRARIAQCLWRICRSRQLRMVVAGESVGFAGPGQHLRGGRGWAGGGLRTASAHGVAELVRAGRGGVDITFLSPFTWTDSHVSARPLGPVRWAGLARRASGCVMALGGVDGRTARRLPRWVSGVGAIGALLG